MAIHGEIRWPPVGTFGGRLWGVSRGRRQSELISSWARPAWRLAPNRAGSAGFLGSPMRSDAFDWPVFEDQPLDGIASLRLAALPDLAERAGLDERSWLVFFGDLTHDRMLELQGTRANGGSAAIAASKDDVAPSPAATPVDAISILSVPHPELAEERGLSDDLSDAYTTLWHAQGGLLADPRWHELNQVMGHPHWVQGSDNVDLLLLQADVSLTSTGARRRVFFAGEPPHPDRDFQAYVQW
jgi:hypothetical protein